MFNRKKKEEDKKSEPKKIEVLPSIKFSLLPNNNVTIKTEWPTEEKFDIKPFTHLLNIIIQGKFNIGFYKQSIQRFIEKNNLKDNVEAIAILNSLIDIEKSLISTGLPTQPKEDVPIVPADRVVNYHFTQNNISVQSE